MKIQVVTPNYPSSMHPEEGIFVRNLTEKWAEAGHKIDVIHPKKVSFSSFKGSFQQIGPNEIAYRPPWISYSNKRVFSLDTHLWSLSSFARTCKKQSVGLDAPDFIYSKFLLSGAYAGVTIKNELRVPVIADIGESALLGKLSGKKLELARYVASHLDGAVCVSQPLANKLVELGLPPARILLSPNSADPERFRKLDRPQCRAALGLPQGAFIISFVGRFIDGKGPDRVLKAIEILRSVGHTDVFGIFLGKGPISVKGTGVLKAGSVNPQDLPMWLNASNVFVLPTLAEGSCNAIEEAKCVGLPIVTSDIPDVSGQVSSVESKLVDPLDSQQIADAILHYKARGAVDTEPRKFTDSIDRSKLILDWVSHLIQ